MGVKKDQTITLVAEELVASKEVSMGAGAEGSRESWEQGKLGAVWQGISFEEEQGCREAGK